MEGRSELITRAEDNPDLTQMRAIARGDTHAFEELHASYGPGILAYLALMAKAGQEQD